MPFIQDRPGVGVGVGVDTKIPTPESESTPIKTLSTPQPWVQCGRRPQVVANEYESYRCRVNAAEGRSQWRANMKAIAVSSMRPKAAGSSERI